MSNGNGQESKALTTTIAEDLAPTKFTGINRGQLELLKRTLAQGTTDDEFSLFMNTATRLGLDPFARQIYAIKRWNPAARTETMAIQVAIDGFRAIGEATGELDGQDPPLWCGPTGEWLDVWTHEKPPSAAKVVVYRKGVSRGYVGIATYKSFVQTNKDGAATKTWATMPDVMLAKCAESQALRKAFPRQLAGVHTPDEMGQADNDGPEPTVMTGLPNLGIKRADAVPAQPPGDAPFDFALAIATAKTVDDLVSVGNRIKADLPESERARLKPSYEARLTILRGPDPFAAFLADLHAAGLIGPDYASWTADDIGVEFVELVSRADNLAAVNDTLTPWLAAASKPGRGPVVRKVREAIEKAAEARRAELREAGAAA